MLTNHRWMRRPEIWVNQKVTKIIIREGLLHFEMLDLLGEIKYWQYGAFKESYTFDFFNGSKYLQEKGFELVERL